ncbi:MAG: hydrogen peroxide-dependent heme synthase [Chthoniobacter sp.]|jgi:chlorite dismutase|nr:hydrogen peroxide-dependent heme synthase [Chthoniobacter sp.]
MTDKLPDRLIPAEGWHVLHLFYKVEQGPWSLLSPQDQLAARTHLTELVAEIRAAEGAQLLTFAMVSPKADLGFMLLCADLHAANGFEKRLTNSLGPDVLTPVYSFFSMTERSEYTTSEAEYAESLVKEENLQAGTAEHAEKVEAFRQRMTKYLKDRLYPVLPPWPVMCFYPMNKRRGEPGQNWYALSFEERKKLMGGHARVGRTWHGKILQLITGSTGLDDWEWGVTLLAHDPANIKGIVYEMRFDAVSAQFAEFGEFYIGLQVPLDELFRRVQL